MPGLNQGAIKIVFSGTLQGAQTWSTSLWAEAVGVSDWTQTQLNDVAGSLVDAASAGFLNWFNHMNIATSVLNGLTVYTFPTGNVEAAKVSVKQALTGVGSGTDALPTLLAVVASLRSGVPGKSGRGRMYLPLTKAGVIEADSQLKAAQCEDTNTGIKAMIDAFNDVSTVGGEGLRCAIASFFLGDLFPIESTHVNSMIDVQHRREDALPMRTDNIKTIAA